MKIEFPVRWPETIELSEDERLTRRALDQSDQEMIYSYGFITLDTTDIRNFNPSDDDFTTVRTHQKDAYNVTIPYEEFKGIWEELTGEKIFKLKMKEETKKSRRNS